MGVIGIILLIAFVIICVLLVGLVLIQNEEGGGMGGLLGGGNSIAFGSRSGNVLTKTTYTFVALFFLTSFGLAFLNKAPEVKAPDASVLGETPAIDGKTWIDNEINPSEVDSVETPLPDSAQVDSTTVENSVSETTINTGDAEIIDNTASE